MKKGILATGVYIPFNRIKLEAISGSYNSRSINGEKSVASYDEDSVSMAVEAIRQQPTIDEIEQLIFATTTPSYCEKSSLPVISGALGLNAKTKGIELGQSLRGGTSALINAFSQQSTTLVVASDCRVGAPAGPMELAFGDGAASITIGEADEVLAEFLGSASIQDESVTQWRNGQFVNLWEDRFTDLVFKQLLMKNLPQFLGSMSIAVCDLTSVIITGPNVKSAQKLAKQCGFSPNQIFNPYGPLTGDIGVAQSLFLLAAAVEQASPNDKILVISLAEGADLLLFNVTSEAQNNGQVHSMVTLRDTSLTYIEYLRWKGLIETEKPRRPDLERPSVPALYRGYRQNLGLIGSKCQECETVQFPQQRICIKCKTKDHMMEYGFMQSEGKIRTYTFDHLAASIASPILAAVVDFTDGGRMIIEITDYSPQEITIGTPVEMTFRRLYEAGGIHNYYWKARPVRAEGVIVSGD